MVKTPRTVHIHDLISSYPWRELFTLLKKANFRLAMRKKGPAQRPDPRDEVLPVAVGDDGDVSLQRLQESITCGDRESALFKSLAPLFLGRHVA